MEEDKIAKNMANMHLDTEPGAREAREALAAAPSSQQQCVGIEPPSWYVCSFCGRGGHWTSACARAEADPAAAARSSATRLAPCPREAFLHRGGALVGDAPGAVPAREAFLHRGGALVGDAPGAVPAREAFLHRGGALVGDAPGAVPAREAFLYLGGALVADAPGADAMPMCEASDALTTFMRSASGSAAAARWSGADAMCMCDVSDALATFARPAPPASGSAAAARWSGAPSLPL
jgi:hypothetical protein